MAKQKAQFEIPVPAIDGFLEIGAASLIAGVQPTERFSEIIVMIQEHESKVVRNNNRRKKPDLDRVATAQNFLGKIAAMSALFAGEFEVEEEKMPVGFFAK